MSSYYSFFSHLSHFLAYSSKKPKMQLEKGMFIISIDVDVGNRELGVINGGKNDKNVNNSISEYRIGEIDEIAFPLFNSTFANLQIPVTFAIRGQLTELKHSILESLLDSPVKHDIGAHGYYHRTFSDLSSVEAENELTMISQGMKNFGIIPRSFVFPKNRVAHLDLLEKFGYKCYRSLGNLMSDGMYVEKRGQLYNICPSLYIDARSYSSPIFVKKILDIAISKKLSFHIWFHLWNFGQTKESIHKNLRRMLFPIFKYAKKREKNGDLTFETMLSAAEKMEKFYL
jgi:hypothetical protein